MILLPITVIADGRTHCDTDCRERKHFTPIIIRETGQYPGPSSLTSRTCVGLLHRKRTDIEVVTDPVPLQVELVLVYCAENGFRYRGSHWSHLIHKGPINDLLIY